MKGGNIILIVILVIFNLFMGYYVGYEEGVADTRISEESKQGTFILNMPSGARSVYKTERGIFFVMLRGPENLDIDYNFKVEVYARQDD